MVMFEVQGLQGLQGFPHPLTREGYRCVYVCGRSPRVTRQTQQTRQMCGSTYPLAGLPPPAVGYGGVRARRVGQRQGKEIVCE